MIASRVLWILAPVVFLTATRGDAQRFGDEPFDPVEVRSASGTWSLFIDPSSSSGAGSASYRLSRGKEPLWVGELPCTLKDSLVAEDGAFAGTAKRAGLRLMVFGPDGKPRFETTLPSEGAGMHEEDHPASRGVVLDEKLDRVMFRVVHRVGNDTFHNKLEEWRVARWSTGEVLTSITPKPPLDDRTVTCALREVRFVVGLPLLLCRWDEATPYGAPFKGVRYVLTDLDAHPVWELDHPHDYEAGGDERKADRIWDNAWESSLMDCTAPRRFEVQFVADAQRVTFEVEVDEKAPTGWSVREIGRVSRAFEVDKPRWPKTEPELPKLEVERVGTIELQASKSKPIEFHAFDIDDRGRMGRVVTERDDVPRFELCGSTGTVLSTVELPIGKADGRADASTFWISGDRWLVYTHRWEEEAPARAWWLDLPAGKLTELESFDCATIKTGDGTNDGGFVVLTSKSKPHTIETTLSSFGPDGKLRWRDTEAYGQSADGLFSAEDVSVSPRGEIGVLDNIKHEIQRFDMKGKPVGAIRIDDALGRKANYPSDLAADPDGNWVVCDFDGKSPVLRISHEGELISTLGPRFADGRSFRLNDGIHVAPDGRMWATDSYSLLRLDANGAVDLIAGDAPDATSLGEAECSFVDSLGRIALADRRTHVVHVFDRDGKQITLCKLLPDETGPKSQVISITVSEAGEFHIGVGTFLGVNSYIAFDAAGKRLGRDEFKGRSYFQPNKKVRWATGDNLIRLYDDAGSLAHKITRSPDNKWLQYIRDGGVAPDGSLAVIARGGVHAYASNGNPVTTLEVPWGAGSAGVAFNGSQIFLSEKSELWCIDVASRVTRKADLGPELSERSSTRPFWCADVSELWIVEESAGRVLRFRIKP